MKRVTLVAVAILSILMVLTACGGGGGAVGDIVVTVINDVEVQIDPAGLREVERLQDELGRLRIENERQSSENERLAREIERLDREIERLGANGGGNELTSDQTPLPSAAVPMFSVIRAFESSRNYYRENVSFTSLGVNYANGARFEWQFGWGSIRGTPWARYSLVSHDFTTITATLAHIDGGLGDRVNFRVYMDGVNTHIFEVYRNMRPLPITLDITDVTILEFRGNGNIAIGLGNVMIQ